MSIDRDEFLNQVESLKKRLSDLQNRVSRSRSPKAVSEAAADLKNALDELSSLQDDLIDQNAALASARELAEEEKDRYQNLFHLAPDAYLVTDRRSVILEANYTAAVLLDMDDGSLIGKLLAYYVVKEDLKNFLAHAVYAGHRGGVRQFDARLRTKQKRIKDVTVIVSGAGQENPLRWLFRDITERKQVEERMRSSERLATMGTTALLLAQEISNPLNNMFTTVQRLQRDSNIAAGIHPALQELMIATAHLRGLLEKFISFSRLTAIHPSSTDLCLLLNEILAAVTKLYEKRGIKILRIFPGTLNIQADQERLKQAFLNLCVNAVEAMPQGGKLTVHAQSLNGRVLVDVIDTGGGVPQDIDIFDLFTTTKFQAMGMGLPIARQIILGHGGSIGYTSEPGNTVFRIDLPAVAP
jgi:PAS domain S-box-containing protein